MTEQTSTTRTPSSETPSFETLSWPSTTTVWPCCTSTAPTR